jgi:hypothetical protein
VFVVAPAKPLDRFACIRSRDIEEVRDCLARVFVRPSVVPAPGYRELDATINVCRLEHIGFCYSTFGAAAAFEFPAPGTFSMLFPIGGAGEAVVGKHTTQLTPGSSVVASAYAPHRTKISADYEHFVLHIDPQALTQKLAAMTGMTISAPLQFDAKQDSGNPAAQMLLRYVPLLIQTLSGATPPFPSWWIAETEQLLMTLFLCGHQHNYSHLLERDAPEAAPQQVQQAEAYIEANAQRFVTLDELAEVTGVSAFSLFRSFKNSRGYSPTAFASQLRTRRGGG